jgi:hypothetical protein
MDPPELDATGPPPAHRPPSVVTTSQSRSMVRHHADDRPGHLQGGEHLLPFHAPPPGPAARAAPQPGKPRPGGGPGLRSTLVRTSHGQRRTIASRPARCRQATTRPADHGGTSTRCAQPRCGPPHRATPGSSAAREARRGAPRTPERVRPHTRLHRPPGHRTPGRWMSARPAGRTSHRRPDEADRATTGLAGVRTSSRPTTTRWAARPRRVTATWGARPARTAPR